jgi:cell division protein FtsQ
MRAHAAFQPALAAELPGEVRLMNTTGNVLFIIAALLAFVLLLGWLTRQPAFTIRMLRIEGEVTRNSVATIRANALPHVSGNFFTLDLSRARQAFESVPWVRHAIVQRVWPNRLDVVLEEHRAVALWAGEEGADQLVNTQGEVFQANLGDVEDESLPMLTGPEGTSAQVLANFRRLQPMFERLDLRMDALTLSGRGSWHAEFDSGAEIELGRGSDEELAQRTERFVATVTQVIERYKRPLVYADLRHNQGYALRLKGVTTATAPANGRN